MRRFLRVDHLVPVVGVAIFLLVAATASNRPCTPAVPCAPDVASWLALGLLLAPGFMVYAHRWAAAWAALVCAASWPLLERFMPEPFGWTLLTPWLLVVTAVFVARRRTVAPEPASPRAMVARPAVIPRVGSRQVVLAAAVFAVAALSGAGVVWRQDSVDRQQLEAQIVTGTVRAHVADHGVPAIRVTLGDGRTVQLPVQMQSDYPVDATVQVYTDDRGLLELRSEPYDLTPLLTWVVAGFGLGVALLARARRRRLDLRALFAAPQPVRTVRAVDDIGQVHVLVPALDGRTAVEFAIPVDDPEPSASPPEDDEEPVTVPALLYGEPTAGRWCAVEIGGRLRVPLAPVESTVEVPYDRAHLLPQETWDDQDQTIEDDQLTDGDRDAAPGDVREHRATPLRRWFEAIAIGLGPTVIIADVMHVVNGWRGWPAVAALGVIAAVAYEIGWRTQLRPVLRWDVGGIAAVTVRRRERALWTVDSGVVHDDDGTVIVTTGDVVLVVGAPRPWPPWAPQRSPDQLVAALRDTRRQALDSAHAPAPPDVEEPARPLALYLLWAATVAAAVALFGW